MSSRARPGGDAVFLATLFACLSLVGCAHQVKRVAAGPALDGLLAFSRPATCTLAAVHERFFHALWAGNAEIGDVRPGRIAAPSSVRQAFGPITVKREQDYRLVEIRTTGTLLGLPIAKVTYALPIGGDPGDVIYTFAAPMEEVAPVLRKAGFPAKANEIVHLRTDGAYDHVVYLVPDAQVSGHTMFGCALQ